MTFKQIYSKAQELEVLIASEVNKVHKQYPEASKILQYSHDSLNSHVLRMIQKAESKIIKKR